MTNDPSGYVRSQLPKEELLTQLAEKHRMMQAKLERWAARLEGQSNE